MRRFKTVEGALDNLETVSSIADELDRLNIRAVPGNPEACAIAEYVAVATDSPQVSVDGEFATGYYSHRYVGGVEELDFPFKVELSRSVQNFITEFDAGLYPRLISPSFRGSLSEVWNSD